MNMKMDILKSYVEKFIKTTLTIINKYMIKEYVM